mmetsp:Transcript_34202/g.89740  ORF Transcript_34202/g.89740 Transcript_34202/m.89740 type:complete len:109 (-) Transcript_34202:32-358(-)
MTPDVLTARAMLKLHRAGDGTAIRPDWLGRPPRPTKCAATLAAATECTPCRRTGLTAEAIAGLRRQICHALRAIRANGGTISNSWQRVTVVDGLPLLLLHAALLEGPF